MADKLSHIHDDLLGYVPRPGHRQPGLTIDRDGLRFTGTAPDRTPGMGPILAVGDSFTFGQDVADLETWPAQLQRLCGRQVLNGGVSGYGFDQIVLRAERLAAVHKPATVVVSFIADDIHRTEMSRLWWHDKPWFAIEGGQLLHKRLPERNRGTFPLPMRRLLEGVAIELPAFLQYWIGYHKRAHPVGAGQAIACLLTERLAALQMISKAKVIILAQYDRQVLTHRPVAGARRRLTQAVLQCAARNGLATLDSFGRLAAEPTPRRLFGTWHMNAFGNALVANLLAAALRPAGT
jgi:lysophospholipase L1-like esterase